MTSTNLLSFELLSVLLPFTDPFQVTSARFRSRIAAEADTFPRVCELHNTLELLAESKKPMSHLWDHRGGAAPGGRNGASPSPSSPDMAKDAEDLLSFMLNSEFLLYELYREYDVSLNPSLAHWVGICREFDKYTREHAEGNSEWGLRERVLKIRAAFVKAILGDQGPNLAKITPKDFAIRGLDFNVDLSSFRDALHNQGIYDDDEGGDDNNAEVEERERGIEIERQSNGTLQSEYEMPPDNNRYSQSGSVQPENTRTPVNPPTPSIQQEAQAQVASIIIRATTEELSPDLTDRLLSHLANSPSLYPMELLACSVLSALFNTNPSLTRGLVSLFLASGSKSQRKDIITSLQFLPISLGSLEMLNDLVSKTALLNKDETSHLVHGVLSNGVRAAEDMGGVDKQAQARLVRLLCLFLQSVVRCDVVGLEDVYYIIQDLGVKFMYVKEARELWRVYCAN